MNQNT